MIYLKYLVTGYFMVALLFASVQSASAHDELRIRRQGNRASFHADSSIAQEFAQWRQEYCLPTMCPMVLCNNSCASRKTRCAITANGGTTSCTGMQSSGEHQCLPATSCHLDSEESKE